MAAGNDNFSESQNLPNVNLFSTGDNSVFHSTNSSSVQLVQPMNKLVIVKLEDGNFLTWKQQVLIAIHSYGLEDSITGGSVSPSQFLIDEIGSQINNPNFVAQQRQDQLLTSWLLSSISPNILPLFVSCNTTRGVWEAVNQLFVAQSTARVMNYKFQYKP